MQSHCVGLFVRWLSVVFLFAFPSFPALVQGHFFLLPAEGVSATSLVLKQDLHRRDCIATSPDQLPVGSTLWP